MFKNYFKTAYRFLLQNKTFSFINIFGLAVGTLCCLYIVLYVQDQYSYDKHHNNANNIYRLTSALVLRGDKHNNATASPPIAPAMKQDFGEILQYVRVVQTGSLGGSRHLLRYKERSFYEKKAVFVDSTFFDMFTYHFTDGNSSNVLAEPYSVVLLKPVADKLFGKDDPINKLITIDNAYGKHDFKVTGVVDERLGKSHIQANMFITMRSGGIGEYVLGNNTWAGNNFTNSYVKLRPDADVNALDKKLPGFLNKYGAAQLKELGMQKELHLQPVTSIHTTAGYAIEISKTVSPSFLYLLLLIAVLIQVIACINFMNLSTARSSKRAKEVGVRKVVGASRKDLIRQFLSESFLLSLIGVLIALPLLLLVMPYLNQVTQADIQLSFFKSYKLWLMLAGLIVGTGIIAGSYPAFYLSAFKTVKVLKGNFTSHISAAGIRRSLVVFQFVLSIILIAGIIVIYCQLDYIKNKDLGFEKEQKLVFRFHTDDAYRKMESFMSELRQLSEVKDVSKADNYPSQFIVHDHGVYLAGETMANAVDAQNIATDEHVLNTIGVKLVSGRDFRLYDSGKVLINETLARRLGLNAETAPGTKLYTQYLPNPATYVEVAGVMKDFNYNSLHGEVRPFMFVYAPANGDVTNVIASLSNNNYKLLLGKIEVIWHKLLPAAPFEYAFLDDEVQKQYETEIIMSHIINLFALMAILISCLGLFGLATFSAEQRVKEIGIRKVLGASISGLVALLTRDFLKLVALAILIATPVAWWAMSRWLEAFTYRISISWWMFALTGLLVILIALITVSFQTIKAALASPVKSLKME